MNALFWFLTVLLGIYLIFYFFGKHFLRWGVRYLSKKAMQNMEKQSRAYQQNVEENDVYADNIYIDPDTRIKVPKNHSPGKAEQKPNPAEIEEVEFEEID